MSSQSTPRLRSRKSPVGKLTRSCPAPMTCNRSVRPPHTRAISKALSSPLRQAKPTLRRCAVATFPRPHTSNNDTQRPSPAGEQPDGAESPLYFKSQSCSSHTLRFCAAVNHTIEIDEGQRQLACLAFAHLALGRPGFDYALRRCSSASARPGLSDHCCIGTSSSRSSD